ncbi:MAG: energy transducer TonB [Pseudomonadota bacterium]
MALRDALTARSSMQSRSMGGAHPRLVKALAISALLHAYLASFITGGHVGSAWQAESAPTLTVRLYDPAPMEVSASSRVSEDRTAVTPPLPQTSNATLQSTIVSPPAARAVESLVGSGAAVEGPVLTFYPAKQLDIYPALAAEIELRSLTDGATGSTARAQFLLLIDEAGVVKEASVVEGEPSIRFENARLTFLAARFTPAYRNGRAVRSRVLIEVNFDEPRAAR